MAQSKALNNAFKLREIVCSNEPRFGIVGNNVADDTVGFQAFLNACKNRRGLFAASKVRITAKVTLDPASKYVIQGQGYDPNAAVASVLNNAGVGRALECDNLGGSQTAVNDGEIRLEDFCITGSQTTLDGLYFAEIPGLHAARLWVTSHGRYGIHLKRCYGSSLDHVIVAHSGRHGLWLDEQCNAFTATKCTFNSNSRSDGWYNVACVGTVGRENLAVSFIGCDISSVGSSPYTVVTTAYGLVIQYSHNVNVKGCYQEGNLSYNVYVDNTAQNVQFVGNYQQDGISRFDQVNGLVVELNTFTHVGAYSAIPATRLEVVGANNAARTGLRLGRNTYNGGATKTITGQVKERYEGYGSTAPAAGTYENGDIIWLTTPAAGSNLGLICVVAGTPGTWVPFGCVQVGSAYTITNPAVDRALNVTADTVAQVAAVLGTLIADLQVNGVLK